MQVLPRKADRRDRASEDLRANAANATVMEIAAVQVVVQLGADAPAGGVTLRAARSVRSASTISGMSTTRTSPGFAATSANAARSNRGESSAPAPGISGH